MQATVVKALLPITASIPIPLLVFNDPEGSPEIKDKEKIPHSNVILEVECDRLLPKPKHKKLKSVSGKPSSFLCEAKTEQKHRKPLILQKRGSPPKPVTTPEKRDAQDCKAEIEEVEPDVVECTSTDLSFSSQKNKSLLRSESLSQDKCSLTPVTTARKGGYLLKPVLAPEKGDALDGEAESVEVEPDIMEYTSTGSSFSSQKNKSLLRPESFFQDKCSLTPVPATRKRGSLLKPVIVPDKSDPLDCEKEILVRAPDKRSSISSQKKKSLLKPQVVSQDKILVNPVIATRKDGSLLKPLILPEKESPPHSEPEIVEPDRVKCTSTQLSISSQKNKSLLRPESLSQDKCSLTCVTTTREGRSLLKPVLPEKKSPLNYEPEIVEVEPDIVECTRTGLSILSPKDKSLLKPEIVSQDKSLLIPKTTTRRKGSPLSPVLLPEERDLQDCAMKASTKEPNKEESLNRKLINFKNASKHIVTTARPANSLLKPTVVSNPVSLCSTIGSGIYKRSLLKKRFKYNSSSRKEQMEITRTVDRQDQGVGNFSARLCGGDAIDVELPTIEWRRSELNEDKRIFVVRKTGRYRSLLKKQNQATKKVLSTTASVPTEESGPVKSDIARHPRMDYHIDESGTFVFDCTRMGSGNRGNTRKKECPDTPRKKQMKTATQENAAVLTEEVARTKRAKQSLAVLKSKLKKNNGKLHSRHRRVSSSVSRVAELKNLIADLKSRDLITESALALLNEAVDHSLSVYKNNNFYDDFTTDT